MENILDIGSTKFNIEEEYYLKFCNKYEKEEVTKSSRVVFAYDWQRFLWAFILGVYVEKRTPIVNKTKNPPFGKEVFEHRQKILQIMIGLTLQELYKDDPNRVKTDFEEATNKGENFGKSIKLAIEEYANTGFSILAQRAIDKPGYIETIEYVITDILSDYGYTWD